MLQIKKRDGRVVPYTREKIETAIFNAVRAVGGTDFNSCVELSKCVEESIYQLKQDLIDIETVQNMVEKVLVKSGHYKTAKAYILYRQARTEEREINSAHRETMRKLTFEDAEENDTKRENANVDGNTAMGTMLKFGSESAKDFFVSEVLAKPFANAHRDGDIHIHDLDFLTLTETCCQLEIEKLLGKGFSTGHGFLRSPNGIISAAALACIAIQANQNDQHGGQSIPNFDYGLAPYVKKTYSKAFKEALNIAYEDYMDVDDATDMIESVFKNNLANQELGDSDEKVADFAKYFSLTVGQPFENMFSLVKKARKRAEQKTSKETHQAMEALVHNLNSMHSRAGAQVPFSSINYGTDTSPEGRMIIKNVLLATEEGLGKGETPIFPIHIFKVKEDINYNPGDPNYDLFKLACRVSAKRLFPNFSFLDAPFNKQYYREDDPNTEVAYMGCRTRVIGNVYDPSREVVGGRGNLSFTSINLPRIAIESNGDIDKFFVMYEEKIDLVIAQLMARYNIQAAKKAKNYPFLMGQGVWLDSEKLGPEDTVGEVLKHGTLTVGFIGLAECLKALIGKHHGESEDAQKLGLRIIGFMREKTDAAAIKTGFNYSVIATPAEGLSGRFLRLDKKRYGVIEGVTDRDYYTNSFHVPVHYNISAFDKIRIEAPYHNLTNAGHISYVEVSGDPLKNLEAFEAIVRCMKENGIGYGSINHPVDRCPICGFTGIIDNECPSCGAKDGVEESKTEFIEKIHFERVKSETSLPENAGPKNINNDLLKKELKTLLEAKMWLCNG